LHFLCIFFAFSNFSLQAQSVDCVTKDVTLTNEPEALTEAQYKALPWYGNENYLTQFYDSLYLANTSTPTNVRVETENVWLRVPIKFWVYRQNPTTAGGTNPLPNDQAFQRIIDHLNNAFRNNNIRMRFYMRCVSFVDDGVMVTEANVIKRSTNAHRADRRESGSINVHIVDAGDSQFLPNAVAIYLTRRASTILLNTSTLTHEVGHYFGLFHTHQGHFIDATVNALFGCLHEPVDRRVIGHPCNPLPHRRCDRTGDLLCDTPADPLMGDGRDWVTATPNCQYTGNRKDVFLKSYKPDTRNYMAYGNQDCRSNFSEGQRNVMYHYAYRIRTLARLEGGWSVREGNAFDEYEPDNTGNTGRATVLNTLYEHSFHQSPCSDQEDWRNINLNTVPNRNITTLFLEVNNHTNAPIRDIEVFASDVNGNVGLRLNNVAAVTGMNRIVIPCNLTNGLDNILIRTSTGGNRFGRYSIRVTAEVPTTISNNQFVCATGTTFSVINGRNNYTYTWTTSGNMQIVGANNGTSVQVRAISNTSSNTGTVSLTIRNGTCTQTLTQNVWIGIPTAPTLTGPTTICENSQYYYYANNARGATSYNWDLSHWSNGVSVFNTTSTFNFLELYPFLDGISPNTTYRLTCTAINTCGSVSSSINAITVLPSTHANCDDFVLQSELPIVFKAYPNPASEVLHVGYENEEETLKILKGIEARFTVKMYNLMQEVVAEGISKNGKIIELNVSSLPSGVYAVLIFRADKVEQMTVMVE
jgi:hypothetical protein